MTAPLARLGETLSLLCALETPSALEAESGVIGRILLDGTCLPQVTASLGEEDFALPANRQIFAAARDLAARGEPVDAVTVRAALGDRVPPDYLMQLLEVTPTAANVEAYVQRAKEASLRRYLRAAAEQLGNLAKGPDDPQEVIAQTLDTLEDITGMDLPRGLATSEQAMASLFAHRAGLEEGRGLVTTGLDPLDRLLGGGLLAGGLYVLAARPGMGKTALALQMADHVARVHGPVLYVSLEMDQEQLSARRAARVSGLPIHRLLMGKLEEEELQTLARTAAALGKVPLYLNRSAWAGVEQVGRLARQVKGLRCVVVDYFGLLRPPDSRAARYETMTQASAGLKALARSQKVPILCLAQLNRELAARKGGRPQLTDLRDTGALEQDADGVILLHRPDWEQPAAAGSYALELILAKNRHGPTGSVPALFRPHCGQIAPS